MPSAQLDGNRDGSEMGGKLWVSTFLGGGGKTKKFFTSMCELLLQQAGARDHREGLPGANCCPTDSNRCLAGFPGCGEPQSCASLRCSPTAMSRTLCYGYPYVCMVTCMLGVALERGAGSLFF